MLAWQKQRCLENSLKDFLDAQVITDSVTDIKGNNISIRVGRKNDDNWTLPCISLFVESGTMERDEIGSNHRDERDLMVIDIYATDEGERLDLAKWLTDSINDGWTYYNYTYNSGNSELPIKTQAGLVHLNFLTNTRVQLGQNVDVEDAHRHNVTINVWVSE